MNWISLKAEWHSFGFLQIEQGQANIRYVQTCSTAFFEHKSFLLHDTSTYIFQDIAKTLGLLESRNNLY